MAKLTRQEKLREFWKYNLNPITGFETMKVIQPSSNFIKTIGFKIIPKNRFRN